MIFNDSGKRDFPPVLFLRRFSVFFFLFSHFYSTYYVHANSVLSKKLDSAVGMSAAVTFVMVVATLATWPVYTYLLEPNGLAYLQTIVFILVIATLCIIATNFSSNTVCATVFYTISAPIALAMGNINMVALASVIGAAASYAFATPPSTMPMAVVAGTGWVDVKDMFKYGGLMALLSIVILAFVGYPIAAAVL